MRDTWLIVIFFKAGLLASTERAPPPGVVVGCAAGAKATGSVPNAGCGPRPALPDVAFLVVMPCLTRTAAWSRGPARGLRAAHSAQTGSHWASAGSRGRGRRPCSPGEAAPP